MISIKVSPRVAVLAAALLITGCAGGSTPDPKPAATPEPPVAGRSIAVLGHSGTTGYNSDPADPSRDATENAWATGTNPEVQSIYQRLLAESPDYQGHNVNLGEDGASVDQLPGQIERLLKVRPAPDVVLLEFVDNDVQCDGTDAANYGPFADKLTAGLKTITQALPGAKVYLLSQWGTVQHYVDTVKDDPNAIAANSGEGECAIIDANGDVQSRAVTHLQGLVDEYHARLATVCKAFRACAYDGGAMQKLTITEADLTPDLGHLTPPGQRKYAALVWKTFFA